MLVYRIGFHPLAKFPGPFWGKITDLQTVGHCLTRDRHIRLEQLHQKYVTVDGHHFPAGTILAVEPYVLHHRQDIFPNPWAYDPDRWIVDTAAGGDDQSVVHAKRAFCPFSVGPRACIGMGFTYREMMMVLAALCITFDMRLAAGTRNGEGDPRLGPGRHRPEEMQLEDRFVGKPIGGPVAQFRRRSQRAEGV
ncbi:cytochrome P450 4A5 [Talaromyces pinophilus]|uniref:Cytochrome P450 4A5 n=1 Tax=Talaromyces pinophilus TaxID=128442 RepID=A0A0B8N4X3_TALPI|nr:cytochrome P450 4A5 [Talaromyces pinophilus]